MAWYWAAFPLSMKSPQPASSARLRPVERSKAIGVADLAGINPQAHAAVAGHSAVVEGAKGAIAIVSMVVDEEADPEVGGRPLPITAGPMLVVTLCEGVRESSCALIPRRSEIHTSGIPVDH